MPTLDEIVQGTTKAESIYRGLCNAEERRREVISLILEKVSTLLPIQASPKCKTENTPKEKCILTDIEIKVENLEDDNRELWSILETLRKIV